MKRVSLVLSSLALGVVLAGGCAGDDRPVVGIEPDAGEANGGSTAGTTQGGNGGTAPQAGEGGFNDAGRPSGGANAGASSGGAGGEGGA